MDVLLTWVGTRDPGWLNPRTNKQEQGPVLMLLEQRRFDVAYLLCTPESRAGPFPGNAGRLLRVCARRFPAMRALNWGVELVDPTDYLEVYRATFRACRQILDQEGREDRSYFVYLQPGTPQMQTVWVLLVQSGLLPARLLATVAPEFRSPTAPAWRQIDLSLADLPQVISPDELARRLGVLQAQNLSLAGRVQRLEAELALLRSGDRAGEDARDSLLPGFSLRQHLADIERAYYLRALDQAGNNAAAAARLLGLEPAAFRKRAASLGVKPRRRARHPRT